MPCRRRQRCRILCSVDEHLHQERQVGHDVDGEANLEVVEARRYLQRTRVRHTVHLDPVRDAAAGHQLEARLLRHR